LFSLPQLRAPLLGDGASSRLRLQLHCPRLRSKPARRATDHIQLGHQSQNRERGRPRSAPTLLATADGVIE
jgi:hypothetical protein